MKCPHCHFDSPAGMKFCGQCGAKLVPVCGQCGTENPAGFKFCGTCGAKLGVAPEPPVPLETTPAVVPAAVPVSQQGYTPAHLAKQGLSSQSALEGERKQVTVLFCDLVGSTALAEKLGPEAMHSVLNRFFELALAEVHRYEGTVNQFLGDGFMALFGAPIAHEDHARRAALAAIGLKRSLAEHEPELRDAGAVGLSFRMGIHTGWVVVGGIGDQLRRDYTAIGDTTNLAARLQSHAESGTILVSEDTARFLQGTARLEPLPPFVVKGKEAPVRAARLLGVGLLPTDDAILAGSARTPFVGRRREMATLVELGERAAAGEGQVVGIAAEAGSGKSRLLHEFRRRLGDRPVRHLTGRCLSYAGGMPYLPILYLLRNAWQIGEADEVAIVSAKVRAGLTEADLEVEEALPYFLSLFGVEEGTAAIAELSAQARQSRTFRLVRQWILNESRRQLVIVEIEDLHWVDPTSEELLALLAEGLFAARVLLVTTYRAGYRPPWIEKSYATQISLPKLSDAEGAEVMRSVLARVELPASVVSEVLGKAEGNPFFVEELTRALLERPDVGVPDTIQGVLIARIDRLPEGHKRLLQTCSVLGREFTQGLLARVWDGGDDPVPLVADLKRWEFLYEEPTADEPRYLFKHALTQEAVYATLLKGRRQGLHAAAGRAYEALFAARLEDAFETLAHHFSEAGEPRKAVHYLVSSARRAAARYAHAEAEGALRKALVHCQHLPAEESPRCRVEIGLLLAESLLPLTRFSATLEVLADLAPAVEQLGEPALSARYHFWRSHTYSYLGDQAAVEASAREAIAAARLAGDAGTEGRTWYVLCRDAFWSGRFSEGIAHGREATTLLARAGDLWWQGQAEGVAGFHHYVLGQFEEAFEHMRRADGLWRALQDPRLDPSWSTGYFHASLGRTELGIEQCQAGVARAQDPLNRAAALGFLGYAHLEREELAEADAALSEAVESFRQAGMPQLLGWFQAFLADARRRAGRAAEAERLAREALAATEDVGFRYGVGLAQRVLGVLAREAGDPAASLAWLGASLASFEAIAAVFEAARTRLELARSAGPGTDTAAREIGEARRVFSVLRVPVYVERAEALAAELAPGAAIRGTSVK